MRETIKVETVYGTCTLCYGYYCENDYSFYDVYDDQERWLGELPASFVEDNCIDEETEEYDEDGLAILIEDMRESSPLFK